MKRFHKAIVSSFLIWIACLITLVFQFVNYPILKENSSKFIKYRTSKEGELPEAIIQYRQGVSKEIWIAGKDGRISCHLESPSSSLKFDSSKALLETLSHLKLWIREPNEQIRYLRASFGDYNYRTQILSSHKAFISSYKITNANNSLFTSEAEDLVISFKGIPFGFTAKGFTAHLQTGGAL